MLPDALLSYELREGIVVPTFLGSGDAPWVRATLERLDPLVGATLHDIEREWETKVLSFALRRGARARAANAIFHLWLRHHPPRVDAARKPAEIRLVVFEEAAKGGERGAVLERAARRLESDVAAIERGLFADRRAERRASRSETDLSVHDAIAAHNLSLVQGLLLRAEDVDAVIREHVTSVVRIAKLRRLITTFEADGEGTRVRASGPLSLFHNTTKYGHAIASFAPAALATPGARLSARCRLREGTAILHVSASDGLASPFALPRAADSDVERRLVRDVRKLRTTWEILRETSAIPTGTSVFFPDFALRRGDATILVEIVGFYTPEYLAKKLAALRAAALKNVIVCIDEDLACGDDAIVASEVLRFRRRVDATALIDAAERLAARMSR